MSNKEPNLADVLMEVLRARFPDNNPHIIEHGGGTCIMVRNMCNIEILKSVNHGQFIVYELNDRVRKPIKLNIADPDSLDTMKNVISANVIYIKSIHAK